MPDAADDVAAGATDTSSNTSAPTSTSTTSTSTTSTKVKVAIIMTKEAAATLGVSPDDVAVMQEQLVRLEPHISLCRGLSNHAIQVVEGEVKHLLEVKQREADGHKAHAGGSVNERRWPWSIKNGAKEEKGKPNPDGRQRVYGPMGGAPSEHMYGKQPLEIKGACELHGAQAYVIVGVRSESHCDKRISEGQIGMLGQVRGHVVYCIKGEGLELHIHRLRGDVHCFSEDIARGAFELREDADGFMTIRVLKTKEVSPHGAIAVDRPRIQLHAQHVMDPTPEPLEVQSRASARHASPDRVCMPTPLHPGFTLASVLMPHLHPAGAQLHGGICLRHALCDSQAQQDRGAP